MITDIIEKFRDKIEKGPVYGPFSKTNDPAFVEVMGYSGFDFVILDLEHGPNSVETMQNLIRAAQISGLMPIVRVKENLPNVIGEALDIGAGGIQVPQITSAEQARAVVRQARFAPLGERGVCRFVRAAGYSSLERRRYFAESNRTVIILQLEGLEAIENLDEIMRVEGVDVLFIGPYDLSQSLGIPGEIDHPAVREKMAEILERGKRRGVKIGIFADTPENALLWRNLGVRYLSYSVDVGLFYESNVALLSRIKRAE